MMSKIIKAAQLKINQIGKLYQLGLALVDKILVGQYRGPQKFSQAEVRTTYLFREISLTIIDREDSCLSSTLSSLTLLCSLTSTFFSSLPSQLRELSLDCEVHTLAGALILPSHSVAYNYVEFQELSFVNIFSPQTAYKLNHYYALLLFGLRFASAKHIIFLISLFFNSSVRKLFFNLQLSNPLVKELLLLVGLSDLLVRELFDVQKIDERINNIAVGDKHQHPNQKHFYIAAHKNFFQPSDSQSIYQDDSDIVEASYPYLYNYYVSEHPTQSNLARFLSHIKIASHHFISSVNSLVKAFYHYKSFLSSKCLNNTSIFNDFISHKIGLYIEYLYIYFIRLFSYRICRVDPPPKINREKY